MFIHISMYNKLKSIQIRMKKQIKEYIYVFFLNFNHMYLYDLLYVEVSVFRLMSTCMYMFRSRPWRDELYRLLALVFYSFKSFFNLSTPKAALVF
jgi:hypothetical protein